MSETQAPYAIAEEDRRRAARTAAWLTDPARFDDELLAAREVLQHLWEDGYDTGAPVRMQETLAAMQRIARTAHERKLQAARETVARLTEAEAQADPGAGWLVCDGGSDWLEEARASARLDGETHLVEREGL